VPGAELVMQGPEVARRRVRDERLTEVWEAAVAKRSAAAVLPG
jgi:hypothetical protein